MSSKVHQLSTIDGRAVLFAVTDLLVVLLELKRMKVFVFVNKSITDGAHFMLAKIVSIASTCHNSHQQPKVSTSCQTVVSVSQSAGNRCNGAMAPSNNLTP